MELGFGVWRVLNLRTTTSQKCEAFGGGLVFEAHRLVQHSTLGSRVMKKKKRHLHHGERRSVKG